MKHVIQSEGVLRINDNNIKLDVTWEEWERVRGYKPLSIDIHPTDRKLYLYPVDYKLYMFDGKKVKFRLEVDDGTTD